MRETGFVIERWVNSQLLYWTGFSGEDSTENFSAKFAEAIRFARGIDASIVLAHQLNGNGRVAEHIWVDESRQ